MGSLALKVEDLPHYTYEDYVQWEGRWELIHGIPYAMTPGPRIIHQWISNKINWQLMELLKNCTKCKALPPVDWPIAEDTVVQPDVIVVCGDDIGETKLEITPVVVFEILSPATSRRDKIVKYALYEEAGVKYYCIIDPKTESADVFVLRKDKFNQTEAFEADGMFFDLGPCRIKFDFKKIFG